MTTARLQFECKVSQLEVMMVSGREDDLRWRTTAFRAARSRPDLVILLGHLLVIHEGHWGQALVQGQVIRKESFQSDASARRFIREYAAGLTEQMYDEGRRVLSANAAMLDLDFELPAKAPAAELEVVDEPEVDEGIPDVESETGVDDDLATPRADH